MFPYTIFAHKATARYFLDFKVESDTELSSVPPSPGLLVAEKYVWQSVVTGQPCFKIKSTGSKAAVLVLSPGLAIEMSCKVK